MAGGEGLRMAQSGGTAPKPLMTVAGTTLLERNVRQLVRYGFDEIVIAAPSSVPQIAAFARARIISIAAALGCRVEIMTERAPLGNFGAVQTLAERGQPALVVYADNLAALNLRAIFDFHAHERPAMTIAAHEQDFILPYGVVQLEGSDVIGYREKPVTSFSVCSAICVVGESAMRTIAEGEKLGISEMVVRLITQGKPVRAFRHAEPWIDVNDMEALAQAEILVRQYPDRFGHWTEEEMHPAGTGFREAQSRHGADAA
jgi:NDP-sugar pyrophosphorylase family protein